MKLNIGPGPHYQEGWVNVEVAKCFKADVYLEDPMVLPFEDESADSAYVGHILEHIEWEKVPTYLAEIKRVLKPGGIMVVVGPDMWRGLEMWKRGDLPSEELWTLLEWEDLDEWEAPRHFWNCSEKRLLIALEPLFSCKPIDIESEELDEWPVISRIGWQAAIICQK